MSRSLLSTSVEEAIRAISFLRTENALSFMDKVSSLLKTCFQTGHKVIIAGNGGSLCDAAHFAEELTGFFRSKRPALPAIALTDPGHITCVSNDLGYEYVFSRGIEAYGQPGDIFIGLTTSGNSPNIVQAFQTAIQRDLHTISFLGKGGGKLRGVANLELIVEGFPTTDRIQEVHMAAMHMIIEALEAKLFPLPMIESNAEPHLSQIGS